MPKLQAKVPPQVIRTRFYRVAGMTESDVDQTIAPIYTKYTNPACTILAATTDIQVHLRARCDWAEQADALLQEVGSQIEAVLGSRLYTCVGEPIEACVGNILAERGQTLAVAESCTGGTLGERLTQGAGSSRYFAGGFITYSNEAKIKLLGLDSESLEKEGPVSASTARAMAEATRQKLGTDYALSVTGIAGPDGGTEQTPVGTVFIGLATPSRVFVKSVRLPGDRDRVRIMAAQTALDLLRLDLVGVLSES
jgi:nicotinamide-nucleotide amidase